jgi:hypothetical protein
VPIDERTAGQRISIEAGARGLAATVAADEVIAHFGAQVSM